MLAENSQPMIDKNVIEDIVKEILRQEGIIKAGSQKDEKVQVSAETKLMRDMQQRKVETSAESIKPQNMVNDDMRAMIARTLLVFRNE